AVRPEPALRTLRLQAERVPTQAALRAVGAAQADSQREEPEGPAGAQLLEGRFALLYHAHRFCEVARGRLPHERRTTSSGSSMTTAGVRPGSAIRCSSISMARTPSS